MSVVLCYHAIAEAATDVAVPPTRFERQISTMLRRGFRPVVASQLLQPDSARTFAVTFDDGYKTVLTTALPILARLGVPATVFATTDFVDHSVAVAPKGMEATALTWDDLRELRGVGWEVGSHCVTHVSLPGQDAARIRRELVESKNQIEDHLGCVCPSVAYPYGEVNAEAAAEARAAGYELGFTVQRTGAGWQALTWPRANIRHRDGAIEFALKTSPVARRLLAGGPGAAAVSLAVMLRNRSDGTAGRRNVT